MRLATAILCVATGGWLAAACTTTTTVNGVPVPEASASAPQPEANPRRRAEIRLQLAAGYYQKGQLSVALDEVRRALSIDPNYAPAHSMLGLIYLDLGNRRDADASYAQALRLEPDNPEIQNNHGWYLCQTGREREALEFFERAASNRLYRTPALAMQNAGLCMLRIKDTQAAESFLRRSFELDASNPIVKYQLARLYLANHQVDRAGFYYGLLEKGPNAPAAVLWLGIRIAHAKADPRQERQLADELRRRFPESPETAALARGAYDE